MKKILLHLGFLLTIYIATAQPCLPEFEALKPIQVRFASGPQSNYPIIPLYWNRFYTVDVSTGQIVPDACIYTGDPNINEVAVCACFVTGMRFRRVTNVCDPTPCGGDGPLPILPITNNNSSTSNWSQSTTWIANQVPDISSSLAVMIGKSAQVDMDLSFSNGHWLVLSAGNTSILTGNTVTCNSVIQIYPGAQLENFGTLKGVGQIFGSLLNSGTISPGNSPGKFTIVGNYTANSTAVQQIEIASATSYDTIAVASDVSFPSGTAVLDGTLNVSLLNGFVPSIGDSYKIITFASATGAFSNINLPALPAGLSWSVNYNPANITLQVIASSLPVTIKYINAHKQNTGVEVEWATENENNLKNYEVERSTDGTHFNKAGVIDAKGTGTNVYDWFDAFPAAGNNYYRLRSNDLDGRYKYSDIVMVKINAANRQFTIYPNPVTDLISIDQLPKKDITISIYDTHGRLLKQQAVKNGTPAKVEVRELKPGLYFIRLSDGETMQIGRFIKQ